MGNGFAIAADRAAFIKRYKHSIYENMGNGFAIAADRPERIRSKMRKRRLVFAFFEKLSPSAVKCIFVELFIFRFWKLFCSPFMLFQTSNWAIFSKTNQELWKIFLPYLH